MPSTYEPIATTTLGSATPSYTFSSIPSTYTDLILVGYSSSATSSNEGGVQFNGDTSTNYSETLLFGNGTAAASARAISLTGCRFGGNALQQLFTMQILNYSNATTYKTTLTRSVSKSSGVDTVNTYASLWRATPAAITSLTVRYLDASNITAGSIFTLYGIKAA